PAVEPGSSGSVACRAWFRRPPHHPAVRPAAVIATRRDPATAAHGRARRPGRPGHPDPTAAGPPSPGADPSPGAGVLVGAGLSPEPAYPPGQSYPPGQVYPQGAAYPQGAGNPPGPAPGALDRRVESYRPEVAYPPSVPYSWIIPPPGGESDVRVESVVPWPPVPA